MTLINIGDTTQSYMIGQSREYKMKPNFDRISVLNKIKTNTWKTVWTRLR